MSYVNIRTAALIVYATIVAALAVPLSASAQQCLTPEPRITDYRNFGARPSPDEQNAVLDVINEFGWTLDLRDADNFANLFATDAIYEACTGGGVQITRTEGLDALETYFRTQPFAYLSELSFFTRHFITNTIVRTEKEKEYLAWATLVVTLQRPDVEAPVLDYTATFVMKLNLYDGELKFTDVRMITGTPVVVFRAR